MIVYNLSNNNVNSYSNDSNPLHAVCNAWAIDKNKMSLWSQLLQDNAIRQEYVSAGFPVIATRNSIACGDWSVFTL